MKEKLSRNEKRGFIVWKPSGALMFEKTASGKRWTDLGSVTLEAAAEKALKHRVSLCVRKGDYRG